MKVWSLGFQLQLYSLPSLNYMPNENVYNTVYSVREQLLPVQTTPHRH